MEEGGVDCVTLIGCLYRADRSRRCWLVCFFSWCESGDRGASLLLIILRRRCSFHSFVILAFASLVVVPVACHFSGRKAPLAARAFPCRNLSYHSHPTSLQGPAYEGLFLPLQNLEPPRIAMDLVLEAFDTFLFDPIYAALLPAKTPSLAPNATFSSVKEVPTNRLYATQTGWEYKPASQYLTFTPRQSAYMSQWPRDDWRRQLSTLFLITWYASHPSSCFLPN